MYYSLQSAAIDDDVVGEGGLDVDAVADLTKCQ